jgi:hypothetical protein
MVYKVHRIVAKISYYSPSLQCIEQLQFWRITLLQDYE